MDADLPRMPEKQAIVAKADDYMDEDIKRLNEITRQEAARGTISCGPIAAMDLGHGWEDLGDKVAGGRPAWRIYTREKNPHCNLQIFLKPQEHPLDTSTYLKKLTQKIGPVPKSEWNKIAVFEAANNPDFFTMHSVEVAEIGGKHVIIMSGQNKDEKEAIEKSVYVSLSGDWKESYEFGIGSPADQFGQAEKIFDKALKTVRWIPAPNSPFALPSL